MFRGDPYRVLDVRPDASSEHIKRRWRELAREHHPDRAGTAGGQRGRLTTRMAPPTRARLAPTAMFHRRNAASGPRGTGLRGIAPADRRRGTRGRDLRASRPTGPVSRTNVGGYVRTPTLDEARATGL